MLISYNTERLQEVCYKHSTAVKFLGEEAAICLQGRHSDIQAADNVSELPFGDVCIEENSCSLTVSNLLSIIMVPNYATISDDAQYDWPTVKRVKIMRNNDVK